MRQRATTIARNEAADLVVLLSTLLLALALVLLITPIPFGSGAAGVT